MLHDLRYAIRSFFRQPSFAITATLTLALGIGATTAIFSVVNAVLLRPLPFEDSERIVAITNYWTRTGTRGQNVSAPDFHDWKAQSRSFAAMGYYTGGEWSVTIDGAADYAAAFAVTPGFLEALRAKAALGRLLSEEEQKPDGPLAAVITDAFWKRQFTGSRTVLGSTIKLNERIYTVVGVLPPGVRFPARADFYYPAWVRPETTSRSGHNYRVVARLRDGVSLEQARSEMTAIATRLEQTYPGSNEGKSAAVVPLQELVVSSTRQTLYMLLGAVGLVLLIACANVANLLLARASNRSREMVVRAAVGAGRGRLVRQLLTESAVLAIAAALCGAWLARLGVRALVALAPAGLPRINEVQVDTAALTFSLVIALLAILLFGLTPAIHVSRVQLVDRLRQGGKGSSVGAKGGWARSAFVVAEIALAVVLVVAAGLLGRSLAALAAVDMGFNPERLLVLRTAVPIQTRDDAPRATAFYRDLLGDLRATPGIDAISGVFSLPTQVRSNGGYTLEGGPGLGSSTRLPQAVLNVVTPDYFRTLRIPIRAGRDFTDGDRYDAPLVAIVNDALVRQSFTGQDPIGRRIQCGLDRLDFMTIVGVVADVRTYGPATPAQAEIYMPYEQHPMPASSLNIVARTHTADPLALLETIRRKISSMNPDVPMRAATMEETLQSASETPRFRTLLLIIFASVALLLALAGVYGVMAYTVSQRIPELGVRIAFGATPENIMRLVLGQGLKLGVLGLVLGVALALLFGRVLEGLLFGVTPRDPIVLVGVTLVIALATLAACYIPARRAVRVDPIVALRAE
jgi:putative ABC transport system permease protein